LLLGEDPRDLVAEDLAGLESLGTAVQEKTDNVIDLSEILKIAEQGDVYRATLWLSYFLRIDVSRSRGRLDACLKTLDAYVVTLSSLSEPEITRWTGVDSALRLSGPSRVLPHKVVVWAI
jgi:hypothetical protein